MITPNQVILTDEELDYLAEIYLTLKNILPKANLKNLTFEKFVEFRTNRLLSYLNDYEQM